MTSKTEQEYQKFLEAVEEFFEYCDGLQEEGEENDTILTEIKSKII